MKSAEKVKKLRKRNDIDSFHLVFFGSSYLFRLKDLLNTLSLSFPVEFRISDTFTTSLGRLPSHEQKAVKTTAFDLQMNPSSPGLRYHRLDGAKDKHFWSVSVNMDLRLIVHKTESSILLCYVDHHDKAYEWADGWPAKSKCE